MIPVITLEGVYYSVDRRSILEDVTLSVEARDFIGILGPNGGGKTTLLRLMLGLVSPVRGAVTVLGAPPKQSRHAVGYVPQFGPAALDFPITVRDVVAMGLVHGRSYAPWFRRTDWRLVDEAMDSVAIRPLADRLYGELSGGQRQRCLIARALVIRPAILLLDEPTSSVDHTTESDLIELLHTLNGAMTILLVSHDLGFVSSHINKIICINRQASMRAPDATDLPHIIRQIYDSDMRAVQHHCGL